MTDKPAPYVGRFAPSPSGPLHFGSLLAAVASCAQAKARNGQWLVRIEDIDPPREQPGADRVILGALEAYGFEWDGPVRYQSRFRERHEALVQSLLGAGKAYACCCSRRDLADVRRGPLGAIYPGTCRDGCRTDDVAIRLRTNDDAVAFTDKLQGPQSQRLESESGDFVIKRRDGLIAYHLAVVADDFDQGITEVVRGIDLLDSTPRHIHLQRALGFSTPDYLHIPVLENADGQKLSKLTGARAIPDTATGATLVSALDALKQQPPAELAGEQISDIWAWAIANWRTDVLQHCKSVPSDQYPMAERENGLS